MSLLGLQRQFATAVMAPLAPARGNVNGFIKPNARQTAIERLEIYRRSYWARVLDSLRDDFPGLCAVLGRRAFDRLSKAYLSELPSRSYTLRDLGSRVEVWLRDHPEFAGENILLALDMVRLEWAHIEAFDGETRKPIGPEDLLELSAEMRFGLPPHLRLLELQYPVDDLRIRVQASGGRVRPALLRSRASQPAPISLAVHRVESTVFYRRLETDEMGVLSALRQGRTIGAAIASMDGSPDILETWFTSWSQLGWLCQPVNDKEETS
jgi:hypothetical protein